MKPQEITVLDLANELRRLANGVVKEAKLERGLACMSNLAGVRSLTQLIMDTVSSQIYIGPSVSSESEAKSNPIGFCASKPLPGPLGAIEEAAA